MAWEAYSGNPVLADQAINSARADAARAGDAADMRAALARVRAREALEAKDQELFDAKKALHGQVALKDALKAALAEVAPSHELIVDRQKRVDIIEAAENKTKPTDPWWPK